MRAGRSDGPGARDKSRQAHILRNSRKLVRPADLPGAPSPRPQFGGEAHIPARTETQRETCRKYYLANKEKFRAAGLKWWRANKSKARDSVRKAKYGITRDEYDALLEAQGFCCRICGLEEWENRDGLLHVDHSHRTNKVRGLLCDNCNNLLGRAKDRVDVLENAAAYLRETGG